MKALAVLLAAAAVLPISAQTALGGRFHLLAPSGNLRDVTGGTPGLGAAAFVTIPLSRGLVLRPLVGVQLLPKGDTVGLPGTKSSASSTELMIEALWFPDEDPDRGAYLLGAMGGQQWRVVATGSSPSNRNATRIGASGGLGFQFSPRLGVEARIFWSPVEADLTATGLMVAATVRF
ncbi:MAG: hypothetical protein WCL47_10305 [Holophagaceae bacterium]